MRVELLETEVDRVGINGDVDGAGLRLAIEHDRTAILVELAAPYGHPAEMVYFDARVGVLRVHVVGDRSGGCGSSYRTGNGAKEQADCSVHGKHPP
jgi:hypothetical protein